MASNNYITNPASHTHIFDYENAKRIFNQEIGYVLLDKKLQTRILKRKYDLEKVLNSVILNYTTYKQYFTEKCEVVNENGKLILCQVTKATSTTTESTDHSYYEPKDKHTYVAKIKQILCLDDLFDIMCELHMLKPNLNANEIENHLTNCLFFHALVYVLWKSCEICNSNVKHLDMYHKAIAETTYFNIGAPDGEFTNVFMYIERNTNFVILRPLKSLSTKAIANELLTIFADFGRPAYLDSNILKHLFKDVLSIIKLLNPPFNVYTVNAGNRNHKINLMTKKVKDMISEWMNKTGSSNWAIGIHVVQWLINNNEIVDTYIRSKVVNGPIKSPYHALFGIMPNSISITEKSQSNFKVSKEKILENCLLCSCPIYKVYKCHFCKRSCHFSCCVRYLDETGETPLLINKCVSCANIDMCDSEETILGT